MKTKQEPIKSLADRLSDAYSTGRYGTWDGCIRMLRKRGYDDHQIEAIIRSKWTRWAADVSGKSYGRVTAADLARYMDDPRNKVTAAAVEELVKGCFPIGDSLS